MPKFVVANWKQNKSLTEVSAWISDFDSEVPELSSDVKVIVCPSFPYLHFFKETLHKEGFYLGSQDVSEFENGSHTGNVGASQIKDFCTYSIIGHSERKEDRVLVNKKRDLCLANNIIPIVCFITKEEALESVAPGVVLAMEDPTNISKNGVYNAQDPATTEASLNAVKSELPTEIPLLYGGSVNRDNITNLSKIKSLDGVLIGHASLDAAHFIEIIQSFND